VSLSFADERIHLTKPCNYEFPSTLWGNVTSDELLKTMGNDVINDIILSKNIALGRGIASKIHHYLSLQALNTTHHLAVLHVKRQCAAEVCKFFFLLKKKSTL